MSSSSSRCIAVDDATPCCVARLDKTSSSPCSAAGESDDNSSFNSVASLVKDSAASSARRSDAGDREQPVHHAPPSHAVGTTTGSATNPFSRSSGRRAHTDGRTGDDHDTLVHVALPLCRRWCHAVSGRCVFVLLILLFLPDTHAITTPSAVTVVGVEKPSRARYRTLQFAVTRACGHCRPMLHHLPFV